mgnify:CR=1 FL=1
MLLLLYYKKNFLNSLLITGLPGLFYAILIDFLSEILLILADYWLFLTSFVRSGTAFDHLA